MLLFEVAAAFAVFGIGWKTGRERTAYFLAVEASICPFLYGFAYTRFDIAPTALLLVGIFFFLPLNKESKNNKDKNVKGISQRTSILTSAAITVGALTKWLPAVAWPCLAMAYLRAKGKTETFLFVVVSAILTVATLLPFYLWNSAAFWYPY